MHVTVPGLCFVVGRSIIQVYKNFQKHIKVRHLNNDGLVDFGPNTTLWETPEYNIGTCKSQYY